MSDYPDRVSALHPSQVPAAYGGIGPDLLILKTARCVNCGESLDGGGTYCGHVNSSNGIWVTAGWCDDACYGTPESDEDGSYGAWRATMGAIVEEQR